MSVKRRDLVQYLTENGFHLLRKGGNHSICTNGARTRAHAYEPRVP